MHRGAKTVNWDDLKIFLAVARYKTISQAAKSLDVQHSTVSRRIKALEKNVGVSLFSRANNACELTQAGKKIAAAALNIEKEITRIDGTLTGKNDSLIGPLRVTTINSMSATILMPIFHKFCQLYPDIDLHVIVSSDTINLVKREADIAIRLTNTPPQMLIGKRIATVASTIYGSVNYLTSEKHSTDSLKWLGAQCCDYHKSWTKQSCGNKNHQFNSNDAMTILSAVHANLGVTFLRCFLCDEDPLLMRYCEPKTEFDLGLWVLSHPELKNNARVSAFRHYLEASINEQSQLLAGKQV